MKTDRVVLDTNVLVTLIISKRLNELVEWYKDRRITIYICDELVAELADVLRRRKIRQYLSQPVSAYISFIESISQLAVIDKRFDRAPDIKDNFLFDLAYTTKSYYIVTNDHPLLNMKQVNKIKIISLADWIILINAQGT